MSTPVFTSRAWCSTDESGLGASRRCVHEAGDVFKIGTHGVVLVHLIRKLEPTMSKRPCIENRTFDELSIGDEASLSRTLEWRDIELFAAMSGDVNPAHVDMEFAKNDMFHRIIAHGMWGGALISTVLGTELPGPGTIYISQSLQFRHPIGIGDTVTVKIRVVAKNAAKRRVNFDCAVTNQAGQMVISGMAEVIAPMEKICRERIELPVIEVHETEGRA